MSGRARTGVLVVALAAACALPGAASAHAYLVKTVPAASVVLNAPPPNVQLTYDEAVEPKFAIISVTNAAGQQETTAPPHRSPANPDTLVVPLRPHLPPGWYLIYWRAISVDGHPVQGAFTYAVGPDPGPAPQFKVPSVSATAIKANLLIARWVMFVSVMSAIGLFVLRTLIARPLVRRVRGASLRNVSVAFVAASVVGLIAIPVYLDISTANDSLRSVFDVGALVPLFGVTAFGRAILDLELCFALFCVAGWIAVWLDDPEREQRSVAALGAMAGAVLAAAAVLIVPGAAGHAAQTSPRGLTLVFDWLHLAAGSVWFGGLIGLLLIWVGLGRGRRVDGLATIVPRFSNVALVSVIVIAATGIGETIEHMPAVNALWDTGFGVAILVKTGLLLVVIAIASGNLLRSKPGLVAAREHPDRGEPAAGLLRRLMSGEVPIIAGIVFAAAVLTSLAPPPPAFALQNSALAQVGPGRVIKTVKQQRLRAPGAGLAEQGGRARLVRAADHQERPAGPWRERDAHLQPHRDADAQQQYQLKETAAGRLLSCLRPRW